MHDVFISYSSKDKDITEQVRQILETNGISCWIAPRNIPGGSSYAAEIPAAIRGCTVFLLIGSLHAEASPWIRKELERAIIERKKIIPLMVEDVAFQDEFDFLLSLHQRYAAYEKTAETMETLVRDIRAILGRPAPAKTAPKTATPPKPAEFAPIPNGTLRYDGFYMDKESCGARSYYRFFPDGKMVSAFTGATPAQVYQWLNESYSNAGTWVANKTGLWMTEPLSDGCSYLAQLTRQGDHLIMDGYNSWSKQTVKKECTFLPFSNIK